LCQPSPADPTHRVQTHPEAFIETLPNPGTFLRYLYISITLSKPQDTRANPLRTLESAAVESLGNYGENCDVASQAEGIARWRRKGKD